MLTALVQLEHFSATIQMELAVKYDIFFRNPKFIVLNFSRTLESV
jgi:hypothetical protein